MDSGVRTSADNTHITSQRDPELEAMPAVELITHLSHSRRTADFADAALVFAARERRLAEAVERMAMLRGEIREHEISALEAKAQICRATEKEMGLRAVICALQLGAAETEMGLRAEIRELQLRAAAAEARTPQGSRSSGHGLKQQVGHGLSSIKEEAHAEEVDHKVLKDVLKARVIIGCKVPKEEREEDPARATKKACRLKGTSYHKEVLNEPMEKQKGLKKEEYDVEPFAKKAAATASKLLYRRCFGIVPVEEDSLVTGLNDS